MTNYYINEAILSFSGNISQDSTLNMIRLSDPDAALIISRGKMQDGDELASQVEQQMKKLEKQVKELRYTPAQVVRLGIDGKMEGLEIQSQFIRGNEHVYQYQAVFVLQSSRVMMALTYARSTALTEADRVRWADIKKNLRFRLDPENTASGEAPYGVTGTCTTRRAGGWRSTNWTRKESRITGRRFYGTQCGWRRSAGWGEASACISTATRGATSRWRGWTGRRRAKRMRCCITIRT